MGPALQIQFRPPHPAPDVSVPTATPLGAGRGRGSSDTIHGRRAHRAALAPKAPEPAQAPRDIVPPCTDVERALVDIWKQVLGVKQLGSADNFFDLGGGSLMAIEVMARIEQVLGARLEPRVLFDRPTVGQLAGLLQPGADEPPAPLLVSIRPGGSRPPIFLIGPDHLFHYMRLAHLIDPGHPIYGLQPPYFEGFRKSGITIEDMADAYMGELDRVCPSGECHLVGLCAGGVVAYEMAQRLLQRSRRVGLLAMLDAPCPASAGTPVLGRRAYLARQSPLPRPHAAPSSGPRGAARCVGPRPHPRRGRDTAAGWAHPAANMGQGPG